MNSQNMKAEDYQLILRALESLATSYTNDSLDQLIKKYDMLAEKSSEQVIH